MGPGNYDHAISDHYVVDGDDSVIPLHIQYRYAM